MANQTRKIACSTRVFVASVAIVDQRTLRENLPQKSLLLSFLTENDPCSSKYNCRLPFFNRLSALSVKLCYLQCQVVIEVPENEVGRVEAVMSARLPQEWQYVSHRRVSRPSHSSEYRLVNCC